MTAQHTIEAAAGYLTDRFGKLDVLVNNAGIPETSHNAQAAW